MERVLRLLQAHWVRPSPTTTFRSTFWTQHSLRLTSIKMERSFWMSFWTFQTLRSITNQATNKSTWASPKTSIKCKEFGSPIQRSILNQLPVVVFGTLPTKLNQLSNAAQNTYNIGHLGFHVRIYTADLFQKRSTTIRWVTWRLMPFQILRISRHLPAEILQWIKSELQSLAIWGHMYTWAIW